MSAEDGILFGNRLQVAQVLGQLRNFGRVALIQQRLLDRLGAFRDAYEASNNLGVGEELDWAH